MQDDTNPIDDEIRDNEPRIKADNHKLGIEGIFLLRPL